MRAQLLNHQADFLESTATEALLLGGIGSGKSDAGAKFVLNMVSEYPRTPGMIVAPTYQQLIKASVKAVQKTFKEYGIKHKTILHGADKRIEMPGREPINLFSLQDPDNFRGPESGWLWGDETAFANEYSIKVSYGRIREGNGPLFKRHTSSPNGYNWMYDRFENMDGDNSTSKTQLVRAKTKDNIFLPEQYYLDLVEDYGGLDNPLARQELNGEFVNLMAGAIYWAFDRRIHVQDVKPNRRYPVYVGQDFNIDNMCGCYVQYINGVFYVFGENILTEYNSNTDSSAQKILEDLSGFKIHVIPDSTGKKRATSASSRTDIEILKSYGLSVITTSNPFIRDRQNTVNVNFKRSKVIVGSGCKTLIKELETLSARDKEGDKAHVSVSLGYVLNKLSPLISRTTRAKNIYA